MLEDSACYFLLFCCSVRLPCMLPYFGMSVQLQMAATNTDTFHDINTQRHDRGVNATIRLCSVFWATDSLVQGDSDGFLHLKNGATVSHLGSRIELPLGSHRAQVACAHAVEQSIPSAQVTSLQSAQLFLPAL